MTKSKKAPMGSRLAGIAMKMPTTIESIHWLSFRKRVLAWYDAHRRDLPWRETTDPYAVWVSEIMLQQTTVATVKGYYRRFLERFPDVKALAEAEQADVLLSWQGLGYYRRARSMHAAAKEIVKRFRGRFPSDPVEIQSLPGLGRYTANAIACFAFEQKLPIVEANTRRLWGRVLGLATDPSKLPGLELLWEIAEKSLPAKRVADFNQALMDLGSLICTPSDPQCSTCPARRDCKAHATGEPEKFPGSTPKRPKQEIEHVCVLLWGSGTAGRERFLITQRPAEERWGGLWELPRAEVEPGESHLSAGKRILGSLGLGKQPILWGGEVFQHRHGIMHFQVKLRVIEAFLKRGRLPTDPAWQWICLREHSQFPFSSPQRRVMSWLSHRREMLGPAGKPS